MIKHITVRKDAGQTSLWLTLDSNTNQLDSTTVTNLRKVGRAVAQYFGLNHDAQSFGITKLDTTVDLKGSFMPSLDGKDKTLI